MEFVIKSSPVILFNFLSTTSGLSQWFADHVDYKDDVYSFFWNQSEDKAILLEKEENSFIKFRWDYDEPEYYFEFRIERSEVTGDTILIITDFADDIDKKDQVRLWESQVKTLLQQIGS